MAGVAVDLDGESEGVVDPAAELGIRAGEVGAEVGQAVELGACLVDGQDVVVRRRLVEFGQHRLGLGPERADALADEGRVDSGLDGGEVTLKAAVELRQPALEPGALVVGVGLELPGDGVALGAEVGEALGAEDPAGVEAVDER